MRDTPSIVLSRRFSMFRLPTYHFPHLSGRKRGPRYVLIRRDMRQYGPHQCWQAIEPPNFEQASRESNPVAKLWQQESDSASSTHEGNIEHLKAEIKSYAIFNHRECLESGDRRLDGKFVYGVVSTKIYCRPSCPSRRPDRHHVTFFGSSRQAEDAGFRACRRCHPQSADVPESERRIERTRQYLDNHYAESVTLKQLATKTRMSPYYLQRTFKRILGLSPKAYLDMRRMTAKNTLSSPFCRLR
jgi:methylphosphotriester-DNA--protein-cysteine methyltransferase